MEKLTWMLAGLLRGAARLLPPGRRQWAEAMRAEAGQVPAGWPRLGWLAGGLWLVAREANMVRRVVYALGTGAVAAAAAWALWLSWRTVRAPYYDPQTVTDRVRVLAGVGALVVLPWVARRRGWFGPVGSGITARLVRVAGCAAMCDLGVVLVRMDNHLNPGADVGPFSLSREIAGLVLLGAALAAVPVVKSRWPQGEDSALWWVLAGAAGVIVLGALPLQMLTVVFVAGILAATAQRSPVANRSLAAGTITGLASGLTIYEVVKAVGDDNALPLIVVAMAGLLAVPAGLAAAWLLPRAGDPQEVRAAQIRQGLLAGAVAGAVCGMLLTLIFVLAFFMMVIGPLVGAAAGTVGGAFAADHPRKLRPGSSGAAGLLVLVVADRPHTGR